MGDHLLVWNLPGHLRLEVLLQDQLKNWYFSRNQEIVGRQLELIGSLILYPHSAKN